MLTADKWDEIIVWLKQPPQILGHPEQKTLVSIFKFSLFQKRSMYQEYKHISVSSICFYLNVFHLWLVGLLACQLCWQSKPWVTNPSASVAWQFLHPKYWSHCTCFIGHNTHAVSLLAKYFFTFVRSIILSRLLKHCCKVVFAFSQSSLKSWKRSTSYKQRWQIKFGTGSLADTCDRYFEGKTLWNM